MIHLIKYLLVFCLWHLQADFEASIPNREERERQEAVFESMLSRSQLVCDMAVVVGDYTVLEQFYLHQSFNKALAMDTIEDAANTSSLVDDAFYIVKKSVRLVFGPCPVHIYIIVNATPLSPLQ